MIQVVDRVAVYPGRVELVDVNSGVSNTYDMYRADDASVEGTPINKALFDSIATDIAAASTVFVNLLISGTDYHVISASMTYAQIKQAIGAGSNVVCLASLPGGLTRLFVINRYNLNGTAPLYFIRSDENGTYYYSVASDDTWTFTAKPLKFTPTITHAYDGTITCNYTFDEIYGAFITDGLFVLTKLLRGTVNGNYTYQISNIATNASGDTLYFAVYYGSAMHTYTLLSNGTWSVS